MIAVTSRKAIRNLAVGEFVCRASADHPTANEYHGEFLGSCQAVEGKKGLGKKAARNDE